MALVTTRTSSFIRRPQRASCSAGRNRRIRPHCSIPLFIGQTGRIAVRYNPMPAWHSENPWPITRFFHHMALWVYKQGPPGLAQFQTASQ